MPGDTGGRRLHGNAGDAELSHWRNLGTSASKLLAAGAHGVTRPLTLGAVVAQSSIISALCVPRIGAYSEVVLFITRCVCTCVRVFICVCVCMCVCVCVCVVLFRLLHALLLCRLF